MGLLTPVLPGPTPRWPTGGTSQSQVNMDFNPPIRGWYNDAEVADDGGDPELCDDIAEQLVRREPGRNINVILAGGRGDFYDESVQDVEGEGPSYR